MKVMVLLMVISMASGFAAAIYAAESSNKMIQVAANKYTTYTHKVNVDSCQSKRKEINNRCLYHHKMSKQFCAKQDAKNSAVCDDLEKRARDYEEQKKYRGEAAKASEEKYNECIKVSGCDSRGDDEATKMCYEHCEKTSVAH